LLPAMPAMLMLTPSLMTMIRPKLPPTGTAMVIVTLVVVTTRGIRPISLPVPAIKCLLLLLLPVVGPTTAPAPLHLFPPPPLLGMRVLHVLCLLPVSTTPFLGPVVRAGRSVARNIKGGAGAGARVGATTLSGWDRIAGARWRPGRRRGH
jgi:hypothetical protein